MYSWLIGSFLPHGDSRTQAPFICAKKKTRSNHGHGDCRRTHFPGGLGKQRKQAEIIKTYEDSHRAESQGLPVNGSLSLRKDPHRAGAQTSEGGCWPPPSSLPIVLATYHLHLIALTSLQGLPRSSRPLPLQFSLLEIDFPLSITMSEKSTLTPNLYETNPCPAFILCKHRADSSFQYNL